METKIISASELSDETILRIMDFSCITVKSKQELKKPSEIGITDKLCSFCFRCQFDSNSELNEEQYFKFYKDYILKDSSLQDFISALEGRCSSCRSPLSLFIRFEIVPETKKNPKIVWKPMDLTSESIGKSNPIPIHTLTSVFTPIDESVLELFDYLYTHHRDYVLDIIRFDAMIKSLPFDKKTMVMSYINSLEGPKLIATCNWFMDTVQTIWFDKSPSKKVVKNLLAKNNKAVHYFFMFVSRPLEHKVGVEQMFDGFTDPLKDVAYNINEITTDFNATCMGIRNTVIPSTLSTMKHLNTLVDPIKDACESIKNTADKTNATIEHLERAFSVKESDFYENLMKHKIGIIAQLQVIMHTKTYADMMVALVPVFSMLGFEPMVIDKFKTLFTKKVATEQSFDCTKKMFGFILTMFGNFSPDSILKGFSANMVKSFREMEALDKLMEMVSDVLAEFGFDISSKAKATRALQEDLKYVLDKLVDFETIAITNACKFCDEKYYREFMICYDKVCDMKKAVDTGTYASIRNSNFCIDLMRVHTQFKSLRKVAEEIRSTSGRRVEPLAFLFLGPRKIGKSRLILDFPKMVYKYYKQHLSDCEDYDFMDMLKDGPVWSQNPQDEYHQGYYNQLWHINDDLFSRADHSDHQDWLNFISPVCFLTKQAELQDKGKPYQAMAILGSANNFPTTSKVVLNIDALQRRFVVIRTSKQDDLPSEGTHDNSYSWLKFDMIEGDSYTENAVGKTMTLDELIVYYLNGLRLRQRAYEAAMTSDQEEFEYTKNRVIFESDFCNEIKSLYTRDRQLYKKMSLYPIKHEIFKDNVDGVGRFRDLISHHSDSTFYRDSFNMIALLCVEIARTGNPLADIIFSVRMPNGMMFDFDMSSGVLKNNFRDEDRSDEQQQQYQSFYMRWYYNIKNWYYSTNGLYRAFTDAMAFLGNIMGHTISPFFYTIITLIATIQDIACNFISSEPDWSKNLRLLLRGISLAPFIPLFAMGIGAIVYKLFDFSSNEICTVCVENSESKQIYDELLRCFYYNKENAENMWPVISCIFSRDCKACKDGICRKKCLHAKQSDNFEKEYILLAEDFYAWYHQSCEEGNRFEEVSPKGLKQKRVTRKFARQEKAGYVKLLNVDSYVIEWEKENPDHDSKIYRHLLENVNKRFRTVNKALEGQYNAFAQQEVSPNGMKQKASRRYMGRHEGSFQEMQSWRVSIPNCYKGNSCNKINCEYNHEEISPIQYKQKASRRYIPRARQEDCEIITPQEFDEDLELLIDEVTEEYDFNGCQPGSKKKKTTLYGMKEQMTNDLAARQVFAKITKMTIQCYSVNGNTKSGCLFGHPFGLDGKNYVVTPAHLYPLNKNNSKFYAIINDKHIEMTLVNYKRTRDVAIWSINYPFMFPRTFYDQLISEKEVVQLTNRTQNALQHLPTTNILQFVECTPVVQQAIQLQDRTQDYDNLLKITGLKTTAPLTVAGDCGGIVILYNTRFIRKILGFHVVGARDCAYSAILSKDLIMELLKVKATEEKSLGDNIYDSKMTDYPIVDIMNIVAGEVPEGFISTNLPTGDFEYLGEYSTFTKPAGETQLHAHPFKDIIDSKGRRLFEEKSAPAFLKPSELSPEQINALDLDNEGRPSIIVSRTKKYGKYFKNKIDKNILTDMEDQLCEYYADVMKDIDLGISSDYEILNGDMYDEASHPLDMRTSAGIPHNCEGKNMGKKKEFYTDSYDYVNIHGQTITARKFNENAEYLLKVVNEKERLAAEGYRVLSPVKACLKDEVRENSKRHKPRVFMAFPFDSVILHRKYFLKFKTAFTKNGRKLFHAVGINVTSPAWTELYNDLKEKSDVGGDADFGSFDGNLRAEFMDMACRIIIRTILKNNPEVDEQTLKVLLDEIVRTITIAGKTLYIDSHGNPSGCVLTTIINCIVNMLYHWYCFRKITKYEGLGKFIQAVCLRCFGDDVVYSCQPIYNFIFENISKIMIDELEQDYTDAAKNIDGHSKKIEDLTFLKRTFKPVSASLVLAPLAKDSLEQQFLYTMIDDSDFATHFQCITEVLIEAVQHGPEYFNDLGGRIKLGIQKSMLKYDAKLGSLFPRYNDYEMDLMQRFV